MPEVRLAVQGFQSVLPRMALLLFVINLITARAYTFEIVQWLNSCQRRGRKKGGKHEIYSQINNVYDLTHEFNLHKCRLKVGI